MCSSPVAARGRRRSEPHRVSRVLHFDRWWNPAVEDQATDRAHRLGQTRRVQVHHRVSMGTLEGKSDRMIKDKCGLSDAVLSGGEAWLPQLWTDELRCPPGARE